MDAATPQYTSEIMAVEMVIENELAQGLSPRGIAQTYALALRSRWPTDWSKVNRMILDRWDAKTLDKIKRMAHSGSCFPAH